MINPTSNWVHPTDGYEMFEVDPNDLTIENAVEGTSGTAYTTLANQITNAYTPFLDSTYGVAPITSSNEFQGYPKPTVTCTFNEYSSTSDTNNSLRVVLTVPNKVGFDIVVAFQNLDVDATVYEATLPAGQVDSGNLPMFTTTGADIDYTITWYAAGSTNQYTPTLTGDTTGTLVYTEPVLRDFSLAADFYDSDLCLTTTTATGYYLGSIWSSQALTGGTGQTLYEGEKASNGGNTLTGAKVFRVANLSLGYDKIVTNSSSVVTSWIQCSP